jgi:zinc transporter
MDAATQAPTAQASAAQTSAALPGLLFAMRFDAHGVGHLLDPHEAGLRTDAFGQGFLWLHFDLGRAELGGLIGEGAFGPQRLAATVFGDDHHQRVTVEGNHVGGVVADLARAPSDPDDDATARLHFIMGPRSLVSGRRRPVESPEAAREAAREGTRIPSPFLLLESLIGYVIASITERGERLTDELDAIEDHILEARVRGDRRRLGPIRRDAVRLHRQLLGLRAVFHRLEEDGERLGLESPIVTTAARLAQRLDALDRDMTLAAERARLMQEELSARLAEQSNRQLYTLSILTALFLPPTLITGIFGINTKGLPLADHEYGSWIVIAMAVASAGIAYGIIRVLGIRAPRE